MGSQTKRQTHKGGGHPAPGRDRAQGKSQMRPRPPPRPWTADEEKKLNDFLRAGKDAGEIATALQRTRQAIYARLQRLDIKRKKAARRLVEIGLKAKK